MIEFNNLNKKLDLLINKLNRNNNSNINVAVLVYGRLKKANDSFLHIKNSLDQYKNVDYFMSSDNANTDDLNNFIKTYNPKAFDNTPKNITNELKIYPRSRLANLNNMLKHFLNKLTVFNLCEDYYLKNNIKYDVILSIRCDIYNVSKFNFNKIIDNHIYVPIIHNYFGMNDQIAYGNITVMKHYMTIFNNLHTLIIKQKCAVHPETLTLRNLSLKSIHINKIDIFYILYQNRK
jgi:hypothetical protein